VALIALSTGIIALVFRRSTWALAGFAVAALLLTMANTLPSAGVPWLQINGAALFVAFVGGMLVPPRFAIAGAIVLPVLVHIAWSAAPEDVIATGYAAWDGWIPPIQTAVMLLLVNAVWWRLRNFATAMDVEYRHSVDDLEGALAESERQAALRRAAIVIHESLLNSIRAALATGNVDSSRLSARSLSDAVLATPVLPPQDASMIGPAIAETAEVPITFDYAGPDKAELDPATFEAVRAAVVELVRNDVRYGDTVVAHIQAECHDGQLTVSCPGRLLEVDPLKSGLGVRTAVRDSLEAIGASVEQTGERVTIRVPLMPTAAPLKASESVFARSRGLMTAFLGAMALSGVLYFVAAITSGARSWPVYAATVLALIAGVTVVMLTLRSGRLPAGVAASLALIPALVPWLFAAGVTAVCSAAPEISASAVNVTGFAVIGIALWSRWWVMAPTLGLWVAGMLVLIERSEPSCSAGYVQPLINSVVVMPLFVAGTLIAARAYSRASLERETVELARLREAISLQAQTETNSRLKDLVDQVTHDLSEVARGGQVDREFARRLRLSEGRIRAAVQVDPVLAGGFNSFASMLVETLAARGIVTDVKLLEASDDRRPLPAEFAEILTRAASGGHAAIAAFQDGEADYLTISAPASDVPWAGEAADMCIDGVDLLVDEAYSETDPAGARIFVVRRALTDLAVSASPALAPA
jgi:hypothetical protein